MTKSDLAQALSQINHISVKNAATVVEMIFLIMNEALHEGQRIELRGFGSFSVREYDAYAGRNPRTGEVVRVKAKRLPFFKVGKELRERVNAKSLVGQISKGG